MQRSCNDAVIVAESKTNLFVTVVAPCLTTVLLIARFARQVNGNFEQCNRTFTKSWFFFYQGELQMQTPEQEPEHQWHQNCLLIRDTEMGEHAFARGGDSGAVLFDEDGNAVGLLFGCLVSRTGKLIYGLASPMEVVLRELEVKTGRKLELKTKFAQ